MIRLCSIKYKILEEALGFPDDVHIVGIHHDPAVSMAFESCELILRSDRWGSDAGTRNRDIERVEISWTPEQAEFS